MKKILEDAVTRNDDDTWDFRCPGVQGDLCGPADSDQGFVTLGWPTKATAAARGQEHFDEHKGLGPMSGLEEFREKHGLTVNESTGLAVRLEDLP